MVILQLEKVKTAFTKALLKDGEMSLDLYRLEIHNEIGYLRRSQKKDRNDYIICLTSNHYVPTDTYKVAMVLIHKNGKTYVNEDARERLKELWVDDAYKSNMQQLIPLFAKDIANNNLAITGVSIAKPKSERRSPKGFGN